VTPNLTTHLPERREYGKVGKKKEKVVYYAVNMNRITATGDLL